MDAELQKIVDRLEGLNAYMFTSETIPNAILEDAITALRSYVPPRTEVVITAAHRCDTHIGMYNCPACHSAKDFDDSFNYCPRCGAKIVWQLSKDGE